jgi:hypothetical protein
MIKESPLKSVESSHKDVNTYYKFFKDDLKYDRAVKITDTLKQDDIKMRSKIIDELEDFFQSTPGRGKNPYTVNVITFSGHGYDHEGESIAVITEREDKASTEK